MDILGISFLEGRGFIADEAMSDLSSWDEFLAHLALGEANTSTVQIWDAEPYEPRLQSLRLYIETTSSKSRYILTGESLRDGESSWKTMSDEDVGSWLTEVGIETRYVYGGGLAVTLEELGKLPDAVKSMKKGFVKEVIESL